MKNKALIVKNVNSYSQEYDYFCKIKPLYAYDGESDFYEWQSKAREKLTELLGLPLPSCDVDLEIEYERSDGSFTEYRFTVQTEPGYYVPCHLLIPKGKCSPIPLTVCLSGHGAGMHIALGTAKNEKDEKSLAAWPHRAMAPRALKEGRAALVIEARNFGEASVNGYGTSCTEAAKVAILSGRTVIGERVSDAMRILDAVLDIFPEIDKRGIMCTGNSGGGTTTYYLACLDSRIAVAAPSCAVCTYEASIAAMEHCMCNHIPYIKKFFEMGDLAGLIAPRRLIVAAGMTDPIFPIEGTRAAFETAKRLYSAAGVPEKCSLVLDGGGHFNYADLIWREFYKQK